MGGLSRREHAAFNDRHKDLVMPAGGKIRVMVADDEPHIRAIVVGLVETLGGEIVAQAGDGVAAVTLFARLRPEVAILDINMPGMRGGDALRRIMAIEPRTRVVMMTAQDTIETVQECLDLGARHYVLKGNGPVELYALFTDIWRGFEQDLRRESFA